MSTKTSDKQSSPSRPPRPLVRASETKKLQDFLLEKVINFIKFARDSIQPMARSGQIKEYIDQLSKANTSVIVAYIVSDLLPNQNDFDAYVNRWMQEMTIDVLPEMTKIKLIRYLKCFCDIVSLL